MERPAPDAAQSLPDFLAARARRASDVRLVVNAGAGLLGMIAVIVMRPMLWLPLSLLGACFTAYGAWGILDRELSSAAPGRHPALRSARSVAAGIGAIAGISCILTFCFSLVGSWIS